ncbi:MAG TPA: hypothetical protein VK864_20770, partial [Longimicrobiales bacterium]|nr:hypothetical protein [Longimicrobiales bacterium]
MAIESVRDPRSVRAALIRVGLPALALIALADPALAQQAAQAARDYGEFPVVGSRIAIWVAAQV